MSLQSYIAHMLPISNIIYWILVCGLGKRFDDPLGHCGKESTTELMIIGLVKPNAK